jgi:hypothetical protein
VRGSVHWGCEYATALDIKVDPQRCRFGRRESDFALQALVECRALERLRCDGIPVAVKCASVSRWACRKIRCKNSPCMRGGGAENGGEKRNVLIVSELLPIALDLALRSNMQRRFDVLRVCQAAILQPPGPHLGGGSHGKRGQRRGDVEIRNFLRNQAGSRSLVFDLSTSMNSVVRGKGWLLLP